ncbi:MAG: hypothetical protein NTX32_06610 [Candidatus Firestonebacteria bacterium]|nr:hypothetical protein [Candidatus Firestonebacteria bacterium]
MGVWGQALAIMDLYNLAKRKPKEGHRFIRSAELAGNYLKSLQVTDFRLTKSIGGFREHTPQTTQSYPRDAVTGGFGLCRLFKETRDEEWLDSAKLFAEWRIKYGTDAGGWPYITFDLMNQRSREGGIEVPTLSSFGW